MLLSQKMQNIDDLFKMRTLVESLEQDYDLEEITCSAIADLLYSFGYDPSDEDVEIIERFIEEYESLSHWTG